MAQAIDVIRKIADWNTPRDTYEVPVMLVKENLPIDALVKEAEREGVQNQLGALTDLTITFLLPKNHPKQPYLRELRTLLWANRLYETRPFYKQEPEAVTAFNAARTSEFLKSWNLTGVLTPEKFKEQVELGYEDRQATTGSYSQRH